MNNTTKEQRECAYSNPAAVCSAIGAFDWDDSRLHAFQVCTVLARQNMQCSLAYLQTEQEQQQQHSLSSTSTSGDVDVGPNIGVICANTALIRLSVMNSVHQAERNLLFRKIFGLYQQKHQQEQQQQQQRQQPNMVNPVFSSLLIPSTAQTSTLASFEKAQDTASSSSSTSTSYTGEDSAASSFQVDSVTETVLSEDSRAGNDKEENRNNPLIHVGSAIRPQITIQVPVAAKIPKFARVAECTLSEKVIKIENPTVPAVENRLNPTDGPLFVTPDASSPISPIDLGK